jgi:hypothetical protein
MEIMIVQTACISVLAMANIWQYISRLHLQRDYDRERAEVKQRPQSIELQEFLADSMGRGGILKVEHVPQGELLRRAQPYAK